VCEEHIDDLESWSAEVLEDVRANGAHDKNLSGVEWAALDLTDINLEFAILIRANLRECVLRGANISRAGLSNADLTNADMTNAILQMINARRLKASGACLDGARLNGATLANADLSGASLINSELVGTNLRGANLREANLSGAQLLRASFDGSDRTDAILDDGEVDRANENSLSSKKSPPGLGSVPPSQMDWPDPPEDDATS
jgi:uncharacterized protein YjbI with pentapeptide repeats